MTHLVTEIQRFCMHDGPGIRTTVFLKGCPLNCFWCHNPETKQSGPQLMYHATKCMGCGACLACGNGVHVEENGCHGVKLHRCTVCGRCADVCPTGALAVIGKRMDSEEIVRIALRDRAFYGKEGGLTVSGGEPMHHPEACIELLRFAKENGLHTAVETCGFFPRKYLPFLSEVTDLFLWDVKDTDDERHKANTGVSNGPILENLRFADTFGVPIVLRCVLLKGVNLDDGHLKRVGELYASLRHGIGVDLLPCHSFGNSKGQAIGAAITDLACFEPDGEAMEAAKAKVHACAKGRVL